MEISTFKIHQNQYFQNQCQQFCYQQIETEHAITKKTGEARVSFWRAKWPTRKRNGPRVNKWRLFFTDFEALLNFYEQNERLNDIATKEQLFFQQTIVSFRSCDESVTKYPNLYI